MSNEDSDGGIDPDEEFKNTENGGANGRMSSDYVSSLRNPSFGNNRHSMNQDSLLLNQSIAQNQDVEMTNEEQFNNGIKNFKPDQNGKPQRLTRNMIKQQEKLKMFMKIEDEDEQEYLIALH